MVKNLQKLDFDISVILKQSLINMKVGFLSSSSFTLPILESIIKSQGLSLFQVFESQLNLNLYEESYTPTEIKLVQKFQSPISLQQVISQAPSSNRGKIIENPIEIFCKQNNITSFAPTNLNLELPSDFGELDMAITASYGQFVSTKTLSLPKFGFINWHPSLLPKYRGATPIQMTLLNGENQGGVSWINMTKQMDAGQVYLQLTKPLSGLETFVELSKEFGILGSKTWAIAIVNKILDKYHSQNEAEVIGCSKLDKQDRIVSPTTQTAREIYNHWRGLEVFPGTSFVDDYFGQEIKLIHCSIQDLCPNRDQVVIFENQFWMVQKTGKQQKVYLKCSNNSFLEVETIKLSTGKKINFSGYQFQSEKPKLKR